jgi:hypothetical protein
MPGGRRVTQAPHQVTQLLLYCFAATAVCCHHNGLVLWVPAAITLWTVTRCTVQSSDMPMLHAMTDDCCCQLRGHI